MNEEELKALEALLNDVGRGYSKQQSGCKLLRKFLTKEREMGTYIGESPSLPFNWDQKIALKLPSDYHGRVYGDAAIKRHPLKKLSTARTKAALLAFISGWAATSCVKSSKYLEIVTHAAGVKWLEKNAARAGLRIMKQKQVVNVVTSKISTLVRLVYGD